MRARVIRSFLDQNLTFRSNSVEPLILSVCFKNACIKILHGYSSPQVNPQKWSVSCCADTGSQRLPPETWTQFNPVLYPRPHSSGTIQLTLSCSCYCLWEGETVAGIEGRRPLTLDNIYGCSFSDYVSVDTLWYLDMFYIKKRH